MQNPWDCYLITDHSVPSQLWSCSGKSKKKKIHGFQFLFSSGGSPHYYNINIVGLQENTGFNKKKSESELTQTLIATGNNHHSEVSAG